MKPKDLHDQFGKNMADGNLEGLVSLFHEDAIFIPGQGKPHVQGKDNIREELRGYLNSPANIETLSSKIHENGDIALATSHWKITQENGQTFEGRAIEVHKKNSDGIWQFYIDSPMGE